jgi:hypothetical protein
MEAETQILGNKTEQWTEQFSQEVTLGSNLDRDIDYPENFMPFLSPSSRIPE